MKTSTSIPRIPCNYTISNDYNIAALFYQTFSLFSGTTLTAGIDYKNYGGEAENIISNMDFGNHSHNELGFYIFTRKDIGNRIFLTGGIRIENSDVIDNEIIPQIGAAYRVGLRSTVRGSLSKGFRSPTMQELYMFPPSNPDLEPERVWNYDIGLLHTFANNITIDAALFQIEGSNLIRIGGVPPNIGFENTGKVFHRGAEFSAHVPVSQVLHADVSYAYLDPGDNTEMNPRHTIYTGFNARYHIVSAAVSLQYVSRLYGASNAHLRLPDYTLVNVRFSIYPNDRLSWFLSIENVFDSSYQMMYEYPIDGRLFFTGVRVTL